MVYLMFVVDVLVGLLFVASIWAIHDYRRRAGLPYPPGPWRLPIIGNLLDVPTDFPWYAYTQFSEKYGDIMSFRIFGQLIVVLNSIKVAKDLLEREYIYADRPVFTFHEMMKWQWLLPSARGDEHWRRGRKLLDHSLRPGAIASHEPMLQTRARLLLSRLLTNPHQWEAHIELFQGESILAMTYGYEVHGPEDRMFDAVKRMNKFGTEKILPGTMLVNYVPLLRHIPEWVPWLSYKPLARFGHNLGNEVLYPPMQFVKESILNGTARPSLALEKLQEMEDLKPSGFDREKAEETVTTVLGSIFASGYDSTVSTMRSLLVAILLYPDVQKKAQEELDSVIGRERLPTIDDRPTLPFIDAVCKETLRWRPATPLGVPHATTKDDVYEGFFIPKGAVVIGNSWAILHDPILYPEPDIFKPERFLNADRSLRDDPVLISAFGFGKRICPGRHVVDATLFIIVVSLLSVFNIERGDSGWDKLADYTFTGTLVSRPNPFPCSFIPRDEKARDLVLSDTIAR